MAAVSVWVPVSHAGGRPLHGRGEGERAGTERPRAQVGTDPRSGVGTAGDRDPGQASPERRRAGQAVGPHNLCGVGAAQSQAGPPRPAGASRGGCPAVGLQLAASQGLQHSRIAKEKKRKNNQCSSQVGAARRGQRNYFVGILLLRKWIS